jgi:predicted dehydrogenase
LENEKGVASLYVSLNAPRVSYTCDVYGTRRILRIDLDRQMVLQMGPMGLSRFSIAKDCLSEACRLSLLTVRNTLQYAFRKPGDYLSHVYSMFVDSIRNRRESLVTPEMAYNTVRIVEEICEGIAQTKRA